MEKDTLFLEEKPAEAKDLLTEIARQGAQKMLGCALEAEVSDFVEKNRKRMNESGDIRFVRNGYLPERNIQTGIGDLKVTVPRVRDRGTIKDEIQFESSIVPKYLRRSIKMQEFIPLLYLKGISSGDMREALVPLIGTVARHLSPNVICRLKQSWEDEYLAWSQRCLSRDNYVYLWVDGVYFQARMEEAKDCVLVIIGVKEDGYKELVAIEDGYRESKESWSDLLKDLKRRGLKTPPKVAVGDGALGFWGALNEVYPKTRHQRCWFHKMGNILNALPKTLHAKAKLELQQIWMAETREKAYKAYDRFIKAYSVKYPKATKCLEKDKDALLTFYDFPAEHWKSLRTSNPIESTFATVRHRTRKAKGCYSRTTMLAMVFKLTESAEKRWRRMNGFKKLTSVIEGVKFINGIEAKKTKKIKKSRRAA